VVYLSLKAVSFIAYYKGCCFYFILYICWFFCKMCQHNVCAFVLHTRATQKNIFLLPQSVFWKLISSMQSMLFVWLSCRALVKKNLGKYCSCPLGPYLGLHSFLIRAYCIWYFIVKHPYLLCGIVLIRDLLQLHEPLNYLTSLLSMESLSGSCILTVTPARAKVAQEIYLLRWDPNFYASFLCTYLRVLTGFYLSPPQRACG
jgi:hypothetical protein